MSRTITPVNVSIDTFQQWIADTNTAIAAFLQTVTLAANSIGDISTGNGYVNGVFGSTTLVANTLSGGTVTTPALLTITSNTSFTGSITSNSGIVSSGNTTFSGNSSVAVVSISGNSTVSTVAIDGSNTLISSNVFFNGATFQLPIGNTAQRPAPANGYFRYNTDLGLPEIYSSNTWYFMSIGNTTLASIITFVPNANVTSNNVQLAIMETFNKKVSLSGDNMTGALGINFNGGALPSAPTGNVLRAGQSDTVNTNITLDSFGAINSFTARRASGTNASKTALATADQIGEFSAIGYNGTAYPTIHQAKIAVFAGENWSAANTGTYFTFETTPLGSNARSVSLLLYSNNFTVNTNYTTINGNTTANNLTVTNALTVNTSVTNGIATFNANIVANTTNLIVNNGFVRVGNNTVFSYINQNGISSDGATYYAFWSGANLVNPVSYSVSGTFTKPQKVAVTALTDGATITPDFTGGQLFTVTLGGNRTMAAPTGIANSIGQSITFVITQDGTGSRTLAFNSVYKFPSGTAPVLSTAAGAIDVITGFVISSTQVLCGSIIKSIQ